MHCRQAAELLPWYLNGTLAADERTDLEDHLRGCDGCRAELHETETARILFGGHPSAGLLVDYAFARLEVPREVVESHLAGCGACAAELALVRDSRGQLNGERPPWRPDNVVQLRPTAAPPPWWRAAAAAAVIFGLVGVSGGLWSWRELDRRQEELAAIRRDVESRMAELETEIQGLGAARPGVAIHDLWPEGDALRSAAEGPPSLPVTQGPPATLILNSRLPPGTAVGRMEIRDGTGQVLQSLRDVTIGPTGSITMSLPLARLPRGKLRILLFDGTGDEPAESYTFELD